MTHDGQTGIYFDSHGYRLLGRLWLAAGDAPKPTAVILHGLPGVEQNFDVAFALRDHGWNAVIFSYRGCWGSAGVYNFATLPDDARACLDYLSAGHHPQVDPERLVLIGHSMGGWAAIMAAAHDPRPRAVAALCPIVKPALLTYDQDAADYTPWLPGLSDASFAEQWRALSADPTFDTTGHVAQIAPRPLLVLHAEQDDAVPVAQGRALFDAAHDPRRLIIHDKANHSFTWHRPWFRAALIDWLDSLGLDA